MIRVKLHSAVEPITNSSTVIYTYSEGAASKAEELVNEILALMGESMDAKDAFHIGVMPDASEIADSLEYDEDEDDEDPEIKTIRDLPYNKLGAKVEEIIESVIKGERECPDWLEKFKTSTNYNDYPQSTDLVLIPKEERFAALGKKLTEFLYSVNHEAGYN